MNKSQNRWIGTLKEPEMGQSLNIFGYRHGKPRVYEIMFREDRIHRFNHVYRMTHEGSIVASHSAWNKIKRHLRSLNLRGVKAEYSSPNYKFMISYNPHAYNRTILRVVVSDSKELHLSSIPNLHGSRQEMLAFKSPWSPKGSGKHYKYK